jgi:hypothetical protein
MNGPIKVTISDPDTGEVFEERTISDDYILICAGRWYVHHVQSYSNGATVTVKRGDA